jgi:hypothetical protein
MTWCGLIQISQMLLNLSRCLIHSLNQMHSSYYNIDDITLILTLLNKHSIYYEGIQINHDVWALNLHVISVICTYLIHCTAGWIEYKAIITRLHINCTCGLRYQISENTNIINPFRLQKSYQNKATGAAINDLWALIPIYYYTPCGCWLIQQTRNTIQWWPLTPIGIEYSLAANHSTLLQLAGSEWQTSSPLSGSAEP